MLFDGKSSFLCLYLFYIKSSLNFKLSASDSNLLMFQHYIISVKNWNTCDRNPAFIFIKTLKMEMVLTRFVIWLPKWKLKKFIIENEWEPISGVLMYSEQVSSSSHLFVSDIAGKFRRFFLKHLPPVSLIDFVYTTID